MKKLITAMITALIIFLVCEFVMRQVMHPDTWTFIRVCVAIVAIVFGYGTYHTINQEEKNYE